MGAGAKSAVAVGLVLALASGVKPGSAHHAVLLAAGPASASANVSLGREMAARRGWTGAQWDCEYTLWDGESGWSQYADTRRSGLDPADAAVFAYGIPQARPATKMPRVAWPADLGGQSDPAAQIGWGDQYIASEYGNPCNALGFKRAHGNAGY